MNAEACSICDERGRAAALAQDPHAAERAAALKSLDRLGKPLTIIVGLLFVAGVFAQLWHAFAPHVRA